MKKIMSFLKERNIELILAETDTDGFTMTETRTIIANCFLNEQDLIETILHESEHILNHADYIELYRISFVFRSKMEFEANQFMIEELIEEGEGIYNYSALIEDFGVGIGYDDILFPTMNNPYNYLR